TLLDPPTRPPGPGALLLDKDALPGALLGGLACRVLHALGDHGQALVPAGVVEDLVTLFDVREAVVEQGEHGRRNLFAEPVACAEILIDPDLHRCAFASLCARPPATTGGAWTTNAKPMLAERPYRPALSNVNYRSGRRITGAAAGITPSTVSRDCGEDRGKFS